LSNRAAYRIAIGNYNLKAVRNRDYATATIDDGFRISQRHATMCTELRRLNVLPIYTTTTRSPIANPSPSLVPGSFPTQPFKLN